MNLLLIEPAELVSETHAVLTGNRSQEVVAAHDLKAGLALTVGVFGGKLGKGTVLSVSPDSVELELLLNQQPPSRVPAIVVIAVCRPQTVKKVIQVATTVGIEELHFVRSENSEKSYLDSHALMATNIADEVWKGLEQAQDTVAPIVKVHERFKPFVEDVLPNIQLAYSKQMSDGGMVKLVGDTRSKALVSSYLNQASAPTSAMLAIGSENGWSEYELSRFAELGFNAVTLGPRMLRVDSAMALLLGQFDLVRHV